MAATTPGHRGPQMTIAAQAWQPIDGTGSAQQSDTLSTAVRSIDVPDNATGMIITADQNASIAFRSTFVPTASQGYLLPSMTPSPALLVPRYGDINSGKATVVYTAMTTKGRINFLFIGGRGT